MLQPKTWMVLPTAAAATALTIGITTVGTVTPALAATRGNCTAYASVSAGGRATWKLRYAGSSSGWSPPGNLSISVTATYNGIGLPSLHSSKNGTSVSTPAHSQTVTAATIVLKVSVKVSGPAGTRTCSKQATS